MNKRRILFVGLNAVDFGPSPAAVVISAAIHGVPELRARYETRFLDFVLGRESLRDILWRVLREAPDIVAFSAYGWNAAAVESLTGALRIAKPQLALVVGGPGVTLLSAAIRDQLTYATTAFGEVTLAAWLGDGLGDAPVAWPTTPPLATRPFTDRIDDYVRGYPNKALVCYDASRGCPFGCSFCLDGLPERPQVRRPNEVIQAELHALAGMGYETIDIADNNANDSEASLDNYLDFCERHPTTGLHLETRAEFFRERSCRRAGSMPNLQMYLGLQSTSVEENEAVHRRNNLEKFATVMQGWLEPHERRCSVGVDLIFGLPGQTRESFMQAFDTVAAWGPNLIYLNHCQIYPENTSVAAVGEAGASGERGKHHVAILPNEYQRELVWTSTQKLEDFLWFKMLCELNFTLINGHWGGALNYAVARAGHSPAELYSRVIAAAEPSWGFPEQMAALREEMAKLLPARVHGALCDYLDDPRFATPRRLVGPIRGENWAFRAALDAGIF